MRYTALISTILLAGAVYAQTPPESPKLAEAHNQALRDWMDAGADLERDVFTRDPAAVLQQLKTAETARAAATRAKQAYCDALRREHEAGLASAPAGGPRLDPAGVIASGKDTLTDLLADHNTLATDLKAARPSDTGRVLVLRRQMEAVTELRNLYRQRQQLFEKISALNETLEKNRAELHARYRGALAVVTRPEESVANEDTAWKDLYGAIRRRAIQRAAAIAAPSKPATPAPAVASKPALAGPATLDAFTGKWILSNPRPEKFSDAKGPLYGDVSVLLQVTKGGEHLTGVYNGVVFVPPNETYNPNVNFRFTAPLVSQGGVVEGRIDAPLSGTVRIEWVDEGRIRLTYKIERSAKAASISFKEGGVKELRRQ